MDIPQELLRLCQWLRIDVNVYVEFQIPAFGQRMYANGNQNTKVFKCTLQMTSSE